MSNSLVNLQDVIAVRNDSEHMSAILPVVNEARDTVQTVSDLTNEKNSYLRKIPGIKKYLLALIPTVILAWFFGASGDIGLIGVPAVIALCGAYFYYLMMKVKPKYTELANQKAAEIQEVLNAHAEALALIPSDYHTPEAMDYICSMLAQGRATTISAALAMTDDYLHRMTVEKNTQETAKAAKATAAASVATAVNTRKIAKNTKRTWF